MKKSINVSTSITFSNPSIGSSKLFEANKINTCLKNYSDEVDFEISTRQYILKNYLGTKFNTEILKTCSDNQYKIHNALTAPDVTKIIINPLMYL